jgi:polar amino acid transport system substrate-binding protein
VPPSSLVRPGTITFLSDTTYPPQESIDPSTQQAVGFDIDIAQAIAAKMGLSATIQKTDSPQMIGALLAKKGDAIISALQITPDLERQVALVAYFRAGQAILVRKGNPAGITGIADLCGKKVAVQVQSPEENTVDEANAGVCKDSKISKQVYPTDLQAVILLKQGGVQAALDDSPVAAYFVKQTPDQLELAGPPLKTNPEGIAIDPKNGELVRAVQQAMLAIYRDGSYRQILTKWNLLDGEIPASQILVNPSPSSP